MQLKLILLKCPASSSAELHRPAHFGTAGGSIGRSPDCTVVLPERYVSRVHVEIRHRSDRYSLKVLSKNNPVLINGDSFEHPQACELQEGDRIVIGDYEFSVSLVVTATPDIGLPTQGAVGLDVFDQKPRSKGPVKQEETFPDPFSGIFKPPKPQRATAASPPAAPPDSLLAGLSASDDPIAQLLGLGGKNHVSSGTSTSRLPNQGDLLQAGFGFNNIDIANVVPGQIQAASGVGSSPDVLRALDDLNAFATLPQQAVQGCASELAGDKPVVRDEASPLQAERTSTPTAVERHAVRSQEAHEECRDHVGLLSALYRGIGLPVPALSPAEAERTAEMMGELVAASVRGLFELIALRATVRDELKVDGRTMVASQLNNPLKHTESYEDALRCIVTRGAHSKMFLPPLDAVNESFSDLRAHEMAMIAGMRAALAGLLQRFAPESLERRLKKGSAFSLPIPGAAKSRLWDAFVAMHEELDREAHDDFDKLFGKEFVKAYLAQTKSQR